jgi:nucleotide-binding universal stress UspA family protein
LSHIVPRGDSFKNANAAIPRAYVWFYFCSNLLIKERSRKERSMRKGLKLVDTMKGALVWAIDPFEKETRPDRTMVQSLLNWARSTGLEIQPVHVLALSRESLSEDTDETMTDRNISAAEKVCESYLRELGVTNARPARIRLSKSASQRDAVKSLLSFADDFHADLIVVSSHGRSGVRRLVMGSFAENLLLHSNHPILFLTHSDHEAKNLAKLQRAIFATDFSDQSRKAFLCFLPKAKRLQLELVLFHSVHLSSSALVTGMGAVDVIPEDYFPDQVQWAQHQADHWKHVADSYGVPTQAVVRDEGVSSHVGETILAAAKKENAGLIVMASVSGALSSFVLGSVAREVFRANQYPVWVYGPKAPISSELQSQRSDSDSHSLQVLKESDRYK